MSIGGIGATILGYADKDVDNAVKKSINNGVASSLNCYEEIELARKINFFTPLVSKGKVYSLRRRGK